MKTALSLAFLLVLSCLVITSASAYEPAVAWVPASGGEIPDGAFLGGGEEARPLYICRALYKDGLHPGKVVGENCNIGWGGKEITISDYEVLMYQADFAWVPASRGQVPKGAFAGGGETARDLYICRAEYKDGVHPGKVVGENCNIGWGGEEITISDYEVLVRAKR